MTSATDETAERLREHVETLAAGPRHRLENPMVLAEARDYVTERLVGAGWTVSRRPFERRAMLGVSDSGRRGRLATRIVLHRQVRGINLLATRPGSLGPHLVVGAHLDTVSRSPGADDNASGVAVALELACRLAEGAPVPVMIAVLDAEESGCLGARALARQLVAEQVLSGMVSLECVGVFSSDPGSQSLPPGLRPLLRSDYSAIEAGGRRGDFVAVIHRRSSRSLAEALCAAASAGGLPAVRVSDPRPDGLAGLASTGLMPPLATLDRSDHAAFWRRGVPAVMVTDTANLRNPAYHTPQDVPANLDYTSMARLCDALEKVVRRT